MDKNGFFWLGGIGSIGFYTAVVVVLAFTLASDNIKKIAIKSEQSSIEVSMESLTSEQPVSTPEPIVPIEPEPQKIEPKKPEKIIQHAEAPKKIIKEILKKEEPKKPQMVQQKQPQQTEQPKSAKDLLANLSIKKNSEISFTSNTNGEANEYLSKITKMIKQGWGTSQSEAGIVVIVTMSIEPSGSFTFRIKSGGNQSFNERLNGYLRSLQSKGFPQTTDGKPISVEFNFKAK